MPSDPDELVVRLQQLGRDHRKFGAREAHYAAVGKALIGSLAAFAGAAWTPAIERAWLARYTVAADAMIAAADEDTQPPFWYATVVGHQRCAADLAILHVRPREPYRYTPGQYATIVSRRRPRVWRPYTMATAAPIDGVLEFHVRAVGHGGLSEVLVGDTAIGDVVRVGAPQGTTALRRPHDHVQVFVESGTGWAPTKAFLDQITRNGYVGAPAPHLIHVGSGGPPYDPAWTQLRDRWPGLSTVVAESPDEVGGCLPARVEPNQLEVYVSGPPGLTGSVSAQLAARGVGPRNMLLTSWPGA